MSLPALSWILTGLQKGRNRKELKLIKMKMEAEKINRVKNNIKKTLVYEANQSRGKLGKNYQTLIVIFFLLMGKTILCIVACFA
jgi:hypothetical protein